MQLLKHPFKTTLLYTTFPLVISLICFTIESLISLINSETIATPEWQVKTSQADDVSIELSNSFGVITLLRNIREFMMNSYRSYFYFMGMMLCLYIMTSLIGYFNKNSLPQFAEAPQEQGQESYLEEHYLKNQKPFPSRFLSQKKAIQYFIYFTISYYLSQLIITTTSGLLNPPNPSQIITLPENKGILLPSETSSIPQQKRILVESTPIPQPRILAESVPIPPKVLPDEDDEDYSYEIIAAQSSLGDRLTSIAKLKGALTVVVSKDGKKVFQVIEGPTALHDYGHIVSAMDITDPLVMKFSSPCYMNLQFCYQTLVLSADSNTLFLIDCATFYIFNVTNIQSAPKLITSIKFAEWDPYILRLRNYNDKPHVALYEEENAIIIINNGLHIFDISDLQNPVRLYEDTEFETGPITLLPHYQKALIGGKNGLTTYDISNLTKPSPLRTIMKQDFVITISLSANQNTAFVGVLSPEFIQTGKDIRNAYLSISPIDLENIDAISQESYIRIDHLTSCRVNSEKLPDSVLPDIKMTPDSNYAYWACGQDFGYVDMARATITQFYSLGAINAIALAQEGRVLLKVDSEQINFFAFYHNTQKKDSFIWKPNFRASRVKLNSSSQVVISKNNRIVYVINETLENTYQLNIYDTFYYNFSLVATMEFPTKPTLCVPSSNGSLLYMKIDAETIEVLDVSLPKTPKIIASIYFGQPFDDYFIVSSDDKLLFASQKVDAQRTAFLTANLTDLSNPLISQLSIKGEPSLKLSFSKFHLSKDSKTLFLLTDVWSQYNVTNLKYVTRIQEFLNNREKKLTSFCFSPNETIVYGIATSQDLSNYKEIYFLNFSASSQHIPSIYVPNLSENLPLEISSDGVFLYLSTPEYLMEINITNSSAPIFNRLMKLNLKQFALAGNDKYMYVVVGDYLEIINLRSNFGVTSFKEDFPLGAAYTIDLQLVELNYQNKYDPVYSKHKFLTGHFFQAFISHLEKEPLLSYSVLPTWITFDKDNSLFSLEPRLPSHLGPYKMYTTGSIQVPSSQFLKTLPFLSNSEAAEDLRTDLIERGYLDEDMFLTAKFNASKRLVLSSQYSQFEGDIRYFLREFTTGQEFAFNVSSSLSVDQFPPLISIETLSPHYLTLWIRLQKDGKELTDNTTAQFLKRSYSTPRSLLNHEQTLLTLDGPLLNINEALKEVIIDVKEDVDNVEAIVVVFDNLNPSNSTYIQNVSQFFHLNKKPVANHDLPIQIQVNKQPLISAQPFSITLHPQSYYDLNNRSLEYTLDTHLDWLDLRGLSLIGTPPKQLWPQKVDITLTISNEFKSQKVSFTLDIGYSTLVVIQYVVVYFGYLFSAYKGYTYFHKFYNVAAQRRYQYPKAYMIDVAEEVTDKTVTPVGFFGKEFENADLLINFLKRFIIKNSLYDRFTKETFVDYFKSYSRYDLNKEKLIKTIEEMLEGLTFVERHSVKYYIQINDEQKDVIHQIILDKIIFTEISLPAEKQTLKVFNKIKDQWIDIIEQENPSEQLYFKVNRMKLEVAIQNLGSKLKQSKSSEYLDDSNSNGKNELLDITDNHVRSRYISNSHLFNRNSIVDEGLLTSSTKVKSKFRNVNLELLELVLKAHAFKSHHLNAHREKVTIISKERKVGASCFYKIQTFFRTHLQTLQFSNKEDLGYGIKYVFKKNILHFYGTPDASMEYDTLVVQILNKRQLIMREIYLFGAENKNRRKEYVEQNQEE